MSLEAEKLKGVPSEGLRGVKIIDQDFGFLKPTNRIIIIGAAGTGKSVTMHYIAEGLHAAGAQINMLAPLKIRQLQKEGKLPTWLKLINYKYPYLESNAMTLYDDAQLRSHAREFYEKKHISFNKILSLARHKKAGIIITTQETQEIDRGIIPKLDYLISKKPGVFSSRMERPEFRKISMQIREQFNREIEAKGMNPQEYSYVISDTREGFVGPTGLPSYWTTELGDW